jgi:hypothetical protein
MLRCGFYSPVMYSSPHGAHVIGYSGCRSRGIRYTQCPGYSWEILPAGVINTEVWSSRLGVGREADNLAF